jgi:hypothetical protein
MVRQLRGARFETTQPPRMAIPCFTNRIMDRPQRFGLLLSTAILPATAGADMVTDLIVGPGSPQRQRQNFSG